MVVKTSEALRALCGAMHIDPIDETCPKCGAAPAELCHRRPGAHGPHKRRMLVAVTAAADAIRTKS